jgi:hypothetical protein
MEQIVEDKELSSIMDLQQGNQNQQQEQIELELQELV